jgi:hypothetical protein
LSHSFKTVAQQCCRPPPPPPKHTNACTHTRTHATPPPQYMPPDPAGGSAPTCRPATLCPLPDVLLQVAHAAIDQLGPHTWLRGMAARRISEFTFPFYSQPIDIDALLLGKDPLLKVKLTRLADGDVLSFSFSHIPVGVCARLCSRACVEGASVRGTGRKLGRPGCNARQKSRTCAPPHPFPPMQMHAVL